MGKNATPSQIICLRPAPSCAKQHQVAVRTTTPHRCAPRSSMGHSETLCDMNGVWFGVVTTPSASPCGPSNRPGGVGAPRPPRSAAGETSERLSGPEDRPLTAGHLVPQLPVDLASVGLRCPPAPQLEEERDSLGEAGVPDTPRTHASSTRRWQGPDSPPATTHPMPVRSSRIERSEQWLTGQEPHRGRHAAEAGDAVGDGHVLHGCAQPDVAGPGESIGEPYSAQWALGEHLIGVLRGLGHHLGNVLNEVHWDPGVEQGHSWS